MSVNHVCQPCLSPMPVTNACHPCLSIMSVVAFDILLFKLKYYGVTDTALDLMSTYLKNRKQYVMFNNKQSDYS